VVHSRRRRSAPSAIVDDVVDASAVLDRLLPLGVEAGPSSFAGRFRGFTPGRNTVAAAPICEQEIGQMGI
jgi:hypothetical protein